MKSVRVLAIMGDVFFDPLARSEVVPGSRTEALAVPGSRIEAVGEAVGAEPTGPADQEPELETSVGADREPELEISVGVDRELKLKIGGGACGVSVSGPMDLRVLSAAWG